MEILNEMILETKSEIDSAQAAIENAKADIDSYKSLAAEISQDYEKIQTWADLFDNCSLEAKKMIVAQLIKKVRVGRNYNIEIDLNVSYEKFSQLFSTDAEDSVESKKTSA